MCRCTKRHCTRSTSMRDGQVLPGRSRVRVFLPQSSKFSPSLRDPILTLITEPHCPRGPEVRFSDGIGKMWLNATGFVSGHDFTGCGKTHALCQGTTLVAAKNSCFVSGHGFTACGKTHALYQSTTLQAAEKLMFCVRARLTACGKLMLCMRDFRACGEPDSCFCIRARLYRLRKNSCFVSGHDFSRAVNDRADEGFSP